MYLSVDFRKHSILERSGAETSRQRKYRSALAAGLARFRFSPRRVTPPTPGPGDLRGEAGAGAKRKPGRAPRPRPGRLGARRRPRAAPAPRPGPEGKRPFTCSPLWLPPPPPRRSPTLPGEPPSTRPRTRTPRARP